MPEKTAVTVFEEGLAIPRSITYAEGVRNEAVYTIVKRKHRVPDMLAADPTARCSCHGRAAHAGSAMFGARRPRSGGGVLPGHIDKCTEHLPRTNCCRASRRRIPREDYVRA